LSKQVPFDLYPAFGYWVSAPPRSCSFATGVATCAAQCEAASTDEELGCDGITRGEELVYDALLNFQNKEGTMDYATSTGTFPHCHCHRGGQIIA
jgi:hypothetical protein